MQPISNEVPSLSLHTRFPDPSLDGASASLTDAEAFDRHAPAAAGFIQLRSVHRHTVIFLVGASG